MLSSQEAITYNSLLSIRDANRGLQEAGGDAIVVRVLQAIVDLGLAAEVGLRLLHKHNDVSDGEAMVETETVDEEGYALITSALPQGNGIHAPNSWQLTSTGYVAIEHSTPRLLCAPYFDIEAKREKMMALYELLAEMKVDHLLGPCINYSDSVYGDRDIEQTALLEKTDVDHRANVVRFVDRRDISFTNSAKTKWYAKQVVDAQGNTRWLTACNCFCSVFPEGGHQGTKTHSYSGNGDDGGDDKRKASLTI